MRRGAALLATICAVGSSAAIGAPTCAQANAHADSLALALAPESVPSPRWSLALSPFAGSVRLDPHLGDYLWDVTPRFVWGAEVAARRGGAAIGARAWRASTAQSSGIPGESIEPSVRLTGVELIGEWPLVRVLGVGVSAAASGGRLRVGYEPDRATFVPPGSSTAVEVAYDPIDEWIGGAGVALRRSLGGRVALGARIERSFFALDTAHRNGDAIETRRETFANWTVQLGLSWRIPLG